MNRQHSQHLIMIQTEILQIMYPATPLSVTVTAPSVRVMSTKEPNHLCASQLLPPITPRPHTNYASDVTSRHHRPCSIDKFKDRLLHRSAGNRKTRHKFASMLIPVPSSEHSTQHKQMQLSHIFSQIT